MTIAISTIISTINSLTLSPALAALLLRSKHGKRDPLTWLIDHLFGWFFFLFNRGFRSVINGYMRIVGASLRVVVLVIFFYLGLVALTLVGFNGLPDRLIPSWAKGSNFGSFDLRTGLPTGFIPSQDKGYFLASVQLPDAMAVENTKAVMAKVEKIAKETDGVKNASSVAGNSFLLSAYGSNFGSMFIILKGFDDRKHDPRKSGDAMLATLKRRFAEEIPEAQVNIFPAPAVSGLGRAGGFKLMIEDRGNLGLRTLQVATDAIVENGNRQPGLMGLFTVFKENSPQLFLDIDRKACMAQGVNLGDLFATLQSSLGARYVNDFNRFGRTWQVVVQAESSFRDGAEKIRRIKVRNKTGGMVPVGSIASVREISAPLVLTRYNTYLAAPINGSFAPGYSSGDAIAITEQLCDRELPMSMGYEWSELTFLEKAAGDTAMKVFAMAVVFVFLVLAALYESWKLPLAVILVVPMCVLGSLTGVAAADQDINVFTQVGFVVLIGLACKNAILIVEFAKKRRDEGATDREATLAACELRLRPILMTSFAFILGVLPLVVATGAGAEMRTALGTAVFSGMIGVTLFGIFLTPAFFFMIDSFRGKAALSAVKRYLYLLVYPIEFAYRKSPIAVRWVMKRFRQRAT